MLSKSKSNIEFQIDISADNKVIHFPTLKTVLMIEKVIRTANDPINKSEIKRRIDVKIMHQTLNLILDYMEERGLIVRAKEGYVWTYNPSKKLAKAIKEGREV
jgi:DNA-binding HxlR family transcriptional regulator